jgi:hypothetical protein
VQAVIETNGARPHGHVDGDESRLIRCGTAARLPAVRGGVVRAGAAIFTRRMPPTQEEIKVDSTHVLLVVILVLVLFSLLARGGGGDASRLRSVERKLDLVLSQLGVDPNEGLDEQLKQLVRGGQKIEAIKLYRQQTGVGLKDAKDYIDAHF